MERETYKANAKKSIDAIFAQIDELEAKKNKVKVKAIAEYEELIIDLKARKSDLQLKYNELKHDSDDKWEDAKKAFSSSVDSFKKGVSKITSLFD